MPSRPLAAVLSLLLIGACATPEERCIAAATGELRRIEQLIAETERNIARGYAMVPEPGVRSRLLPCVHDDGPFLFCFYDEPVVIERPVAIDRAVERGKLATLFERRAELQADARARLAACAAAS